jgi:beta-N-acetylhexosaminidase
MRLARLLPAVLALVVAVPSLADDKDRDEEKVSIRGMPASVSPADEDGKKAGLLGTVLMEGRKDKDTKYDKAMVKVTRATKIFQQVGRELKPASFDDIKPGVKMEIQFQGPVAESFPVQATAGKIVILPGR